MRFFEPKPKFFKWIQQKNVELKLPVIDCGCGDGDLVRELRSKSIPTLGIDFRFKMFNEKIPEDLVSCILNDDAETNVLVTNHPSIILVCRPCHSGFPANINDSRHPESKMFYIGFEKNLKGDLGDVDVSLITINIGKEKENLWEVFKSV